MRVTSLTALTLLALACSAPAPRAPAQQPVEEAPATQPAAVAEGARLGERAPDFILPTSGGEGFSLSEHRGKPVVLAFFRGTW